MLIHSAEITGSVQLNNTDVSGITNVAGFATTASVNELSSSIVATIKSKMNADGVISGSSQLTSSYDERYVLSGSITQTTWDNIANKPAGIVSSSTQIIELGFATTGSNTFIGTNVFTGSVFITSDLVVQGSSSLQNITASAVSIGTNTVILNTNTPILQFGGISVQDSGSTAGRSGSLLWNSVNDHWINVNPSGSDEGYNSAMVINGPKNTGSLGAEVGLTTNYIPVSQGEDHITDSIIFQSGSTNIGIGTTTPTARLEVAGTSKFGTTAANIHQFTGSVRMTGSLVVTGSLSSVGEVNFRNITGNSSLDVNYYANDDANRTIYLTHLFKSPNGTNFSYQTYIDQSNYYNYFQHPPLADYANRQGSSTYVYNYNTGYDNALNAYTQFQVNGNDKLILLENGTVVLGADRSVNNSYPSVLRATNAASFSTDSPGKDIFIQGGSGTGTGAGGSVIFRTSPAGSTGTTLNSPVTRVTITSAGVVQPGANGTQDLGTSSLRWATIYTSDLSLSNGIGDYTIVEGENDLFLYNNKQNKVYKFLLAEVDPADATPKKS